MVSSHTGAETIELHGCSIVLRRVRGPVATELYFHCQPPTDLDRADQQAEAAYGAILEVLESDGTDFDSVVSETLFLRSAQSDLELVRAARLRVLAAGDGLPVRPVTSEIEQPPLDERVCLEVSLQAIVPNAQPLKIESIEARSACGCAGCARSRGLRVQIGEEARLYAGGLCGPGKDVYQQVFAMFEIAEDLVRQAGMEFSDVVRTWIHLRDIDRDYNELNRARRAFFEARGIDRVPASTGIGGVPVSEEHDVCLGLYALPAAHVPLRTVMTTPTLNEAPEYGADFARGMKVVETNKIALCLSGTASLDESGNTAHPGNFEAQADRMLVNVETLLAGEGAAFADVVSAITYVKRPEDAARLRRKFREAGFEGFPNVLVVADICRPELLCEIEALAVLPHPVGNISG